MATATEQRQARVYSDLASLIKSEGAAINSGEERAYAVTTPTKSTMYAVTNSPANAALAVVTVERVNQRLLLAEALKAVGK